MKHSWKETSRDVVQSYGIKLRGRKGIRRPAVVVNYECLTCGQFTSKRWDNGFPGKLTSKDLPDAKPCEEAMISRVHDT